MGESTGFTSAEGTMGGDSASQTSFFLPDFCAPRMVLGVVLLAQLLAIVFTLARPAIYGDWLGDLARISLFTQWLALTAAGLLCYLRPWLARFTVPAASALVVLLLSLNTAAISELAYWIGSHLTARGLDADLFPTHHWPFLLRNLGISIIVTAMLLRYFFVANEWRRNVQAEARSRIHALQARIRPHFLFNSMNTIASLTRSDPARAEEAVEDLADLFRVTLRDSEAPLRLKEEFELTRIYQRIEQLRLGSRLQVRWQVDQLPLRALIPGLTLQPLVENAIYHGIEPLPEGGVVNIYGERSGDELMIRVTNPLPSGTATGHRGNQVAVQNIRDRLSLAFGGRGEMEISQADDQYQVTLRFPCQE
jgi:two-component system sensor histidine kinase AlgZ